MNKIIGLLVCIAIISASVIKNRHSAGLSDAEIRSKVVQLRSERGGCTGEQVAAPSGTNYILTAAHCKPLASPDGMITAITEDGRTLSRRIIAEDSNSDLLLIEGLPGIDGLRLGSGLRRFDKVRSFTHGRLLPTYKTEGEIIGDTKVVVMIDEIRNDKEEKACTDMPKNKAMDSPFGKMCMLSVDETATTSFIVPGSSGGPIVDSNGDLVGVASASDGQLDYLVTFKHIQAFLSNY